LGCAGAGGETERDESEKKQGDALHGVCVGFLRGQESLTQLGGDGNDFGVWRELLRGGKKVFFDPIFKPAGSVDLPTLCKLKNKILRASLEIRFHLIIQA
jgi:hypothetical protein